MEDEDSQKTVPAGQKRYEAAAITSGGAPSDSANLNYLESVTPSGVTPYDDDDQGSFTSQGTLLVTGVDRTKVKGTAALNTPKKQGGGINQMFEDVSSASRSQNVNLLPRRQ